MTPRGNDFVRLIDRTRKALIDYGEKINDPEMVLHVLVACHTGGLECPAWVIERLAQAANSYIRAESRSLDEALGLRRAEKGRRWRKAEAQFDHKMRMVCYFKVRDHIEGRNNPSIRCSETEAFERVAAELGGDATAAKVKRNYRAVLKHLSSD